MRKHNRAIIFTRMAYAEEVPPLFIVLVIIIIIIIGIENRAEDIGNISGALFKN